MPTEVWSNLATAKLTADVSTTPNPGTVETWQVDSVSMFPTLDTDQQFRCQVSNPAGTDANPELVIVTATTNNTVTVLRGAEGSPVKTHLSGDVLYLLITAAQLSAFQTKALKAGRTAAGPTPVTLFTIQPNDTTKAPFTLIQHGGSFTNSLGTAYDDVMTLGYNVVAGGGKAVASEPSIVLQFESKYNEPGGHSWVECFFQYSPPNAAFGAIRPFAVVYDRNSVTAAGANAAGMALAAESFSFVSADQSKLIAAIGQNTMLLKAPNPGTNSLEIQAAPGNGAYLSLDFGGVPNALVLATDAPNYGSLRVNGAPVAYFLNSGGPGLQICGKIGFYNRSPVAKPSISGSRGGNPALASLLSALATQGLITDNSLP